jgi:hypothetical protein
MAKLYKSPAGIGSYVTVLEPKPDQQGNLKYSLTLLISKSRAAELEPLKKLALEVAEEKWPGKGAVILAKAKYPIIKDGDTMLDDDGKVKPGYKGMLVISARTDRKPQVIDHAKQEVFTDEDVYSGCMIRFSAGCFAYDYQGNKGVSLGLNNVQVLKKLPRIDGRKAAVEEFEEYVDPDGEVDPLA